MTIDNSNAMKSTSSEEIEPLIEDEKNSTNSQDNAAETAEKTEQAASSTLSSGQPDTSTTSQNRHRNDATVHGTCFNCRIALKVGNCDVAST